jgi:hypothetical protein
MCELGPWERGYAFSVADLKRGKSRARTLLLAGCTRWSANKWSLWLGGKRPEVRQVLPTRRVGAMLSWFYDGPVSAVYYLDNSDSVFGPAYRWRSTTGDSYSHGTAKGPPSCKGQHGGQGRYSSKNGIILSVSYNNLHPSPPKLRLFLRYCTVRLCHVTPS